MHRRHFLSSALAWPLVLGSTRLSAAANSPARLLFVFLRGAYDAASLLVPISSNFYYESRPDIALARPSDDLASSLPITTDWGLHPALRDSLYPLYQRGELAFVPFFGTDDISRSHFETQESIELGQPLVGHKDYSSGFLNRLSTVLTGSAPMAFTNQLPTIFKGPAQVPNTALSTLARPAIDVRQSDIIASMYSGTRLASAVQEGFVMRQELMRELAAEMDAASRQSVSAKGFELEARRIGKLMKDSYRLGFVDVGGWDTHVGQGGATGYLANRLNELGQGLAALPQELGRAWKDTVVVVVSEFGRTLRQNGNRGTDHGHGSVLWVMGGSVRGGQVAGEQVAVERATLFQDRDLPVLNNYRDTLGGLFQRQFGLNHTQLAQVFPGATARDLGLL
ncbi:DUF1501 domain-containing protein [Rhodoferax sp. BLA1]|uniref:DUF1501 domain-containing protein n=1 Tax=Rhodoferax sp. BLA1 TaxID=2576062 RepID=UPI0015D40F92|nr:DUF1501 domain-containing protein [Rhodoferax sp. BLA1]